MYWILNIATNYLRFAVSMVVVFLMTPYIIGQLGMETFGLWSLIFAVIGIFGLMDFGFATAAVKTVAEATGARDEADRNRALASLLLDRSCPRPPSLKAAGDWWRGVAARLRAGELEIEVLHIPGHTAGQAAETLEPPQQHDRRLGRADRVAGD